MVTRTTRTSAPNRRVAWPKSLWIVRHGQSAGNCARDAAEAAGLARIALDCRDVDVPLSPLGERQAHAVGAFFAELAPEERPTVLVTSPYLRAHRTAEIAMASAAIALDPLLDERLREREFGCLDGLTKRGIEEQYPIEAARRAQLGKFYHRPPGGESWCDVFQRLRGFLNSLSIEHAGENVVVMAHEVVVFGFRYLLERMTEAQILGIDATNEIANCAITSYALDVAGDSHGTLALRLFNHVTPLVEAGEDVTRAKDAAIAVR